MAVFEAAFDPVVKDRAPVGEVEQRIRDGGISIIQRFIQHRQSSDFHFQTQRTVEVLPSMV